MKEIRIIDSYLGQNEVTISQEQELKDFLFKQNSSHRVVLLVSPGSGILTLGIGKPYGFVEYMNEDGSHPYLIATDNTTTIGTDAYIEFDSGGTPTPIPASKCLPFALVVDIALYFFRNHELPKNIDWEEV